MVSMRLTHTTLSTFLRPILTTNGKLVTCIVRVFVPDISQKFWNICVVNVLCDGRDNLGHVDASMMRMKRIERTEKK